MVEANVRTTSACELFSEENCRAEELITRENLPGAAKILIEIIKLDPENYRCYNNFGLIAWHRSAWKDAFGMFKKAVEVKPDYGDGLINLFDAALKLRRIAEIKVFFEKARTLNPQNEEIKIIDECIESEGDTIYQSERALRIGTYNPLIEEAHALVGEGKLYQAMEKYLKVNDETGPSADAFSGLGIISYYQKRYNDAFTLFVESLKLNPTSIENFFNLLDAAKACGKVDDAKRIFTISRENFAFLDEIADDFEKAANA
jgi:tetratricopeptide (TPR) repeat protein